MALGTSTSISSRDRSTDSNSSSGAAAAAAAQQPASQPARQWMAERRPVAAEPGDAHDVVDGSPRDSKRQRLCTTPPQPASLTLLAADDDGSRHVVPRAAALGVSELLAEMLGADSQAERDGELVLRVPTSGSATAAFAAFVRQRAATSDAGASAGPHPDPCPGQQPAGAGAALAFPASEWRAAAFFMAAEWQHELSRAWGEAVIAAAARADARASLMVVVLAADWAMDPAVSPLLTMLPAASLAAIYCAMGAPPCPVGEWVRQELVSPPRRADGWLLVATSDDEAVKSARTNATSATTSTHVVAQHGADQIGRNVFKGWTSLVSVAIPDSVTQIGNGAFYGCSSLASVAIPDSVTQIGN
eukprot:SAG11_NODE_6962_length_1218_cov_1.667560_1_plen_359_part_01